MVIFHSYVAVYQRVISGQYKDSHREMIITITHLIPSP